MKFLMITPTKLIMIIIYMEMQLMEHGGII